MSVLVVGDIVTDVLAVLRAPFAAGSDTTAEVRLTGGGAAANTAAWLAAAGVPVTLVATVGDDDAGAARLAELAACGVRLAVRRCPGASTGTIVVLADREGRSMVTDRGANLLLSPSDVDAAMVSSKAAHLHLSGYTLLDPGCRPAGLHALRAAASAGMTTSVDAASAGPLRHAPDFMDWVRHSDVLVANVDEARVLAGAGGGDVGPGDVGPAGDPSIGLGRDSLGRGGLDEAGFGGTERGDGDSPAGATEASALAQALVARGPRIAIVKRGAAGAVWADRSGLVVEVPAVSAVSIDPTGAGDAFAAGFLSAWLDPSSEAKVALGAGAQLGARAVEVIGARPTNC